MNQNNIGAKLGILIVDNDMQKIRDYELFAKRLSPGKLLTVTTGEIGDEILAALEEIYSEGLVPFIILDEELGNGTFGSKILQERILTNHPREGGIILAGSTMKEEQDVLIRGILDGHEGEHRWILSGSSPYGLDKDEIESDLQRFSDLHSDESNVEFKNS